MLYFAKVLKHEAKATVILVADTGSHSLHNLELQHKHHIVY